MIIFKQRCLARAKDSEEKSKNCYIISLKKLQRFSIRKPLAPPALPGNCRDRIPAV
jgi:hypothetical protein